MFNFECSSECKINFISLLEHPQRKHRFESCCSDGYAGLSSLRVACVSSTVFVCVRIRKIDGLQVWVGLTLRIAMFRVSALTLQADSLLSLVATWYHRYAAFVFANLKPSASNFEPLIRGLEGKCCAFCRGPYNRRRVHFVSQKNFNRPVSWRGMFPLIWSVGALRHGFSVCVLHTQFALSCIG